VKEHACGCITYDWGPPIRCAAHEVEARINDGKEMIRRDQETLKHHRHLIGPEGEAFYDQRIAMWRQEVIDLIDNKRFRRI
jgi:hypothetical protein